MGTGLGRVGVVALVGTVVSVGFASSATASRSSDQQLAKQGVLLQSDFPDGFTRKAPDNSSDAEVAKLAKGTSGCGTYIALQKLTDAQPNAKSQDFEDDSRQVSNEVDVFKSVKSADAALAIYARASVPTCLERLFTKLLTQQFAKDPSTKGKIARVAVTLGRQDVGGLGDDSVVYEGSAKVTAKNGTSHTLGIGNAAVRVDRAVSDYTYTTTSGDLTEVLQPAIEASVSRLQDAITPT